MRSLPENRKLYAGYALQVLAIIVLVFIQVQADLSLPDYMSKIVDQGIVLGNNSVIFQQGIYMIVFAFLSAACTLGVCFLAAKVGSGVSRLLRRKTFEKVESFSMAEFDKFSASTLITRSTNDIQQIQLMLILFLRMFISAPMTGVGAVIKAIDKGRGLTWIMIVTVSTIAALVVALFIAVIPKFTKLQQLVDRLNLVTSENLTGLRVVRAYNTEAVEEKKFDAASGDLMKVQLFVNRMMSMMFPLMMIIMNLTSVSIVWVGSHMINQGTLQIGAMMAFIQYTMQVIMSFLMLTMVFVMAPRAAVSIRRVAEVLNTKAGLPEPERFTESDPGARGLVEFKNVAFKYPDADDSVLENISFTANPGETTAFIGSTGSGKSTLINLIPRMYDVTGGAVLVDGVDVRDCSKEALCGKLGYVPQKGVLFSGTVESNIKFGIDEASYRDMRDAAKTAQASEFIDKMDKGFDSVIAQGGQNVSGGQRQRLSIARALVRKPEIYIFDDSFSALDFKTDAALRRALAEDTDGATVLIVAQRISTIIGAEKIVVLDKGRIVGIGTHAELIKNCGVYKEIAMSQFSEEELA